MARTLESRLRTRLPDARIVHADFETVAAARGWLGEHAPRAVLSLRVDRIYCGESVKDGRFGIATLRAAAEPARSAGSTPLVGRSVVDDPRLAMGCRAELSSHEVRG